MRNYFLNFNVKLLKIIREIGKEADRKQLSAYIVGGIVRDIILKRENLDLDIVVDGDAICLARDLAKKWNGKVTVYKKFKTAHLETPKGLHIDFAMARKERYAHSGALPVVRPGSLKEDFSRRDFTINAMAIAINSGCFGQLMDEFGGLTDLSKRTVKVLHDQSFIDDPTRILRAVRFEQRFSFRMERRTLSLMKTAIRKKNLANIKPDRYFNELKKILYETDPLKGLKRLYHLGGLQVFDPNLKVRFQDLGLMHQRIERIKRKRLYKRDNNWWMVYFIGLTAGANDQMVERILVKFHLTKNERTTIQQSRHNEDIIKRLSAKDLFASQVYQILKPLTMETILYLRVRTSRPIVCRRIDRFLAEGAQVKLCINGEDLKKAGITSGCRMGRALEDVLYLKIDKKVNTKREELKAAIISLKNN